MKNTFMKRLIVAVLLASWCFQPVLAVDVSSWSELRAAVQNSGDVTLTSDINSDGAITITADKVINIDGKGYSADGLGVYELFENFGNLTVDNITLQNGIAPMNATAGAIRNYNVLTIGSNAVLTGNQSYEWGGAIHQEYGSTNILSGAKFINNTVNKNSLGSAGYGGAINVQAGTLTIADGTSSNHTIFDGNISKKSGGAIFNDYNGLQHTNPGTYGTADTVTTVGQYTEFKNNQAQGGTGGGAILNQSILNISDNVVFNNNSSTVNGGALAQKFTSVTPEDKKSIVKTKIGNNVSFINNQATGFGGAVYNEDGAYETGNNVSFTKNQAGAYGGAIYNKAGTYLIGNNASFGVNTSGLASEGNTAGLGGGAIANSANMTIGRNAGFYGNKSTSASPDASYPDGGGAILNGGVLHFNGDASFISNTSATEGGAIKNLGSLTIVDGALLTFDSNSAKIGGAFSNYGDLAIKGTYTNNTAIEKGGAINNMGALTVKSGSNFTGNFLTADAKTGGAIYNKGSSLTIENNVTFENNTASYGGALFTGGPKDSVGITTINGVTFNNNKAKGNSSAGGGAIYLATPASGAVPAELYVTNSTFTKNSAEATTNDSGGGALGLFAKSSFDTVTFKENSAIGNDGGGVAFLGAVSETEFINSTFTGNTSTTRGGAISARAAAEADNSGAKLDIINSKFELNTAGTDGGVLHNYFYNSKNSAGAVFINESEFLKNSARDGGAIYNEKLANINDTTTKANINIQKSTFTDNIASGSGGAIYNKGEMTIGGLSAFSNNTASANGGAVYNSGSITLDTTAGDITFSGNTAGGSANDIYMADGSSMNLEGTNTISFAGGIAGENANSVITSSVGTLNLTGDNSSYLGAFNQTGGIINVSDSFFGGKNTISGGTLNILSDASLSGASITGGSVVAKTGSNLSGAYSVRGGSMIIEGGTNTALGSSIVFKDSMSRFFRSAGAADTLTLDTTTADLALNTTITSEGAYGTVEKTGANELNVNVSQDGFTGMFNNEAGNTNISGAGKKFFGGTNNIKQGALNVSNGAELTASSTTNVGTASTNAALNLTDSSANGAIVANNASTVSVNNSVVSGSTTLNGSSKMNLDNNAQVSGSINMGANSQININSDAATGAASNVIISSNAITSAADSQINISSGSLEITGNASGFIGKFNQSGADTKTTVKTGATFFGGENTVTDGTFVFENNALLSSDVKVEGDAVLTILGVKSFDGNKMTVDGSTNGFILSQADFSGEDSKFDTVADNFSGDITFKDNSGIGTGADITLTKNADGTGHLTMGEGSKSDGGQVTLSEGTSFDITASNFDLNTKISGVSAGAGSVNVENSVITMAINSDNSGFSGAYTQKAGNVTVNAGAQFFNGTNDIQGGKVTFVKDSVLNGSNTISNVAEMVINGGTINTNASSVALNGGTLTLQGTDRLTLSSAISGTGNINNSNSSLTINGNVSGFNGTYTQTAGNTIVDGTAFFNNINNIEGGSVTFKNSATVAGTNNLSGGNMTINGGTSFATGSSVNFKSGSTDLLVLDTTDGDINLSAPVTSEGAFGTVEKTGTANNLNINADQNGFTGTFNHTAGVTNVFKKFFGGTNNITAGTVNFENGSTLIGTNTIGGSAGNALVVLKDGSTVSSAATIALDNNGTLEIADTTGTREFNTVITGTSGTISKTGAGTLNLNNDQTFTGNFTQSAGITNVFKKFFGGNSTVSGGKVDFKDGSTLAGNLDITSGNVVLNNGTAGVNANTAAIVLSGENAKLTLNTENDMTYGLNVTSLNKKGTIEKTGTQDLKVNTDVSAYNGAYVQQNGTTTVTNKFFSGANQIKNGSLNLNNGAEIVSGSTVTVNSGASILINGDNNSFGTVNINGNIISTAADASITLATGNLIITGNESGFAGVFVQNGGTTTVNSGATFFGGTNTIQSGNFNFNAGALLANDVIIDSRDIILTIGSADKKLDGDVLKVDGSNFGFILNDALLTGTDSIINTTGNNFSGRITFENGAGIGNLADIILSQRAGGSTYGHFTFAEGSVAQGGAVHMNNGTNIDITASSFDLKTAVSSVNQNDGTVTVKKANPAAVAPVVNIYSDNKNFSGNYTQEAGNVTVKSGGQFFAGTNAINNGTLTFEKGSFLNGNNTIASTAEMVINGGTNSALDSKIVLNNSSLKLQGTDALVLNSVISGTGNINSTNNALTLSGDNSAFTGVFSQTGGTVTVDGGSFFGNTNNLNNTILTLQNSAELAGANNLTNSQLIITGTTSQASGTAINIKDATSKLTLDTTAGDINLTAAVSSDGAVGTVEKTGAPNNLNINTDQNGFTGTFEHKAGTTNVFKKFFGGTNKITAGTVNFENGSTLLGVNSIGGNIDNAKVVLKDGSVIDNTAQIELADKGTLEFAQNTDTVNFDKTVTGSNGTISKSGSGVLNLITDQSSFDGNYIQSAGTTNVFNKFFGKNNTINGGTLNFETGATVAGINTLNNGTVNVKSKLTDANAKINMTGGDLYIARNAELRGQSTISGGTIIIDGTFNNENLKTNIITGGDFTVNSAGTFTGNNTIDGVTNFNVSGTFSGNNTITNSTINLLSGAYLVGRSLIGANSIFNYKGSSFAGGHELTGGIMNYLSETSNGNSNSTITIKSPDSILVFDASANNVAYGSKVNGTVGKVQKTGTNKFTIAQNSDLSGYTGTFEHLAGTTDVIGKFFSGTNNIKDGIVNFIANSTIYGTNNISGNGKIVLNDDVITGNGATFVLSKDAVSNKEGTLVLNTVNDRTFNYNVTSVNKGGIIEKTGAGTLNVSADSSLYDGKYLQSAGNTTVTDKFFGGASEIASGNLNLNNGAEIVAGSTVTVNSGSNIVINGDNNASGNIVINGSIISNAADSTITLETGNLEVNGDQSGFNGHFIQNDGKTTVTSGSKFFHGRNDINGGAFVFEDGALLSNDIFINSDTIKLTIGGNDVSIVNGEIAVTGGSFILNNALLEDTLLTGIQSIGDNKTLSLGSNAGLASNAVMTMGANSALNMKNGSYTQNDSQINMVDNSNLNLVSTDGNFELNADVKGDKGSVNVKSLDSGATNPVIAVNSDNHEFKGNYNQSAGTVTVNSGAKFFGGNNSITGGTLTFKNGSELYGTNTIGTNGSVEIQGGAILNSAAEITNNGSLDFNIDTGETTDLNIALKTSVNDSSLTKSGLGTLIVSAAQDGYKGDFEINGGTVSTNTKFFGGETVLSGSSILELNTGAELVTGSKLTNGNVVNIKGDTSIKGDILASGAAPEINLKKGNLTLDKGGEYSYTGKFNQTGADGAVATIVKDGTTFFKGQNNISSGSLTFENNSTIAGTNNISNGAVVNVTESVTSVSGSSLNLADAVLNVTVSDGNSADLKKYAISAQDNSIINKEGTGTLAITDSASVKAGTDSDNKGYKGQFNINAGTVDVSADYFSGATSLATSSVLNFDDGSQITGGTIANAGTVNFINSTSSVELGAQTSGAGAINKTAAGTLNITASQAAVTGTFTQTAGVTTVQNGGTLFGKQNNIQSGTVNMGNNSQIVAGSTVNMSNGTKIIVNNNGVDDPTVANPPPNGNQAVISGQIVAEDAGENSASIIVEGVNTYLSVNGDQSDYHGIFTQLNGTTKVEDGAYFFNGANTVLGGQFIFGANANLTADVAISNEDVILSILGNQSIDGNRIHVNGGDFILDNATMKDMNFTGDQHINASMKLITNAGFDNANVTFDKLPDAVSSIITMADGSYAMNDSKMNIADENSILYITASEFADTTYTNPDGSLHHVNAGFDMDISGVGQVIVDSTGGFDILSQNNAFTGTYTQANGNIKMAAGSTMFGGNNFINGGSLSFTDGSKLFGNTVVADGASVIVEGGAIFDVDSKLAINGTGKFDSTSKDVDLTNGLTGSGQINYDSAANNLNITADQSGFNGEFVKENGSTVKVKDGGVLFGGTNNIAGGVVEIEEKGVLAGTNNLNGGNLKLNNGALFAVNEQGEYITSVNFTNNSSILELVNNDTDNEMSFDLAITGGTGTVKKSGAGVLNLLKDYDTFTGNFVNAEGTTNVSHKFFGGTANDIQAGSILNLKNGAEIVEGSALKITGTMNIGELSTADTNHDEDKSILAGSVNGGNGNINMVNGNFAIESTSNNENFEGSYLQTGGVVEAKGGSTFFGGTNTIKNGKLIFRKASNTRAATEAAKLANGANVVLNGNSDPIAGDITNAVLDLDGRTNAAFTGTDTLYVDGNTNAGFVFTDGILENAMLSGAQAFGGNSSVTLSSGAGLAETAAAVIGDAKLIFGTGSTSLEGSTIELTSADSVLGLVSSNLDFRSIVSGTQGMVSVTKDNREQASPNINIYGDQSGFGGAYHQDAGSVTVKNGSTFFGGDNVVTGNQVKQTSGDLHLEKGSLLGSDVTIANSDTTPTAGVSTEHGRVFVSDKIYNGTGEELTDIAELIDSSDLFYNTVYNPDGTVDDTAPKYQINIENGGLILSNGTIFETPNGPAIFEGKAGGIIDIGFSNNTGVNGDIVLRRDTMLSYGDNAYIKDNSTLTMDETAILNFINDRSVINYNPAILGGGAIYKEGAATTNISSAIDMKGEVKVKEGTLNFTNLGNVIFKSGSDLRQTGSLTVGSESSNAVINILSKNTVFEGDVIGKAQDGLQSGINIFGNGVIGGNVNLDNTKLSLLGNTTIGNGLDITGESALNLIGGSANTIHITGNMNVSDLKDGKLPISFDYDPRAGAMDQIILNGDYNSNLPLLISGINFVTSPRDRNFNLNADTLIQVSGSGTPDYDPTNFYANTAMGRYYLSNGEGGSTLSGTLVILNPQMYRGQVATIASWMNQLVVNNMLFNHMDILSRQLLQEQKTANLYAAAYPQFAPYQYDLKGGSLWYKAYGNFERLSMTRGLSVGNNAYGSLIGADFPLIKLKNGWRLVPTAYVGYNGAHQTFDGVSMYQNGAQIGFMGTAYKGDFITSLLAYGGGYANDMSVRGQYGSGSDTTGNWFAGVASKTAYNIHLPKDFIFQPTMLVSYNAFGNQNWGSNFGVLSMNSGMLNGVNVAPGFNLIWNKKTFSIYATAQMVYNAMGQVDGRAGNVDLGYLRMRHSYFEYGLGVMKQFKDRFTGYLQITFRNGGRTGVGFQGGMQWKIGK